MKKAIVFQGPTPSDKNSAPFDANDEKAYELRAVVDLDAKTVRYHVGGVTVVDTLRNAPAAVTHVGYAVINAAADFSAVEILKNPAAEPAHKPAAKPKAKRADR